MNYERQTFSRTRGCSNSTNIIYLMRGSTSPLHFREEELALRAMSAIRFISLCRRNATGRSLRCFLSL